jgi:hypothetical protein
MRLLDLNMESNLKYMKMVCNVLLALLYRILACRVPMMPFNTIKNKLHDIVIVWLYYVLYLIYEGLKLD